MAYNTEIVLVHAQIDPQSLNLFMF